MPGTKSNLDDPRAGSYACPPNHPVALALRRVRTERGNPGVNKYNDLDSPRPWHWQVVWFQHGETGNDRAAKNAWLVVSFMPGAARGG